MTSNGSKSRVSFSSLHLTILRISYDLTIYLGIIGNSFAFLVLSRKDLREQPGSIFLRALSLIDVFVLLSFDICHRKQINVINTGSCKFSAFIISVSNFYSKYTLVVLNIDRFLAIYFPLKSKANISYNRRAKMIMGLLILTLITFTYTLVLYDITDNVFLACRITSGHLSREYTFNLVVNSTAAILIAFFSISICVKLCCVSVETSGMVSEETQQRNKQQVCPYSIWEYTKSNGSLLQIL